MEPSREQLTEALGRVIDPELIVPDPTLSIAEGAPQRKHGRMAASSDPGLGVSPRPDVLGEPVFSVG